MRERVLLIGMLNSVHFANWLERIQLIDQDIYLFPSRQYRDLHPKIADIVSKNHSIRILSLVPSLRISVYLEFLLDTKWLAWVKYFSRKHRLSRLLIKNRFTKIHALEIQHAGYLLNEALPRDRLFDNIIVTNWGSDIYYYGQFSYHSERIIECLKMAKYYSAECVRDYKLAQKFGFTGINLPLVPNSTTFSENHFDQVFTSPSQRNQIIMKCYGSTFGYGEMLLQLAHEALLDYPDINIYAYSVTEELIEKAEVIKKSHPGRFRYTSVRSPISHNKMLEEFSQSRIYIGASKSDGVSTSFLEALATGAFPIQTSTSCAGEWVDSGARAGIVNPIKTAIEEQLKQVIYDFETLREAQEKNLELAKARLSYSVISKITCDFYK
jgi:glycosyltransferase involved in cell wall biosynthesis